MCEVDYEYNVNCKAINVNCKAIIDEDIEAEYELCITSCDKLTDLEIKEICIEDLSTNYGMVEDFEIISIKGK